MGKVCSITWRLMGAVEATECPSRRTLRIQPGGSGATSGLSGSWVCTEIAIFFLNLKMLLITGYIGLGKHSKHITIVIFIWGGRMC